MKVSNFFTFQDKKILIRLDLNVPLNLKNEIMDVKRIVDSIPTIKKVINSGGIAILLSHFGRPKDKHSPHLSLKRIVPILEKYLPRTIHFVPDCIGEAVEKKIQTLHSGEIILLENTRFYREEMVGDKQFAKKLASLADVYINDAFGMTHRKHASNYTIQQFFKDKMTGYLIQNELKKINQLLKKPKEKFVSIVGGIKIIDKMPFLKRIIQKSQYLLLGSGIGTYFQKVVGNKIGKFVIAKEHIKIAEELLKTAEKHYTQIILPKDVTIAKNMIDLQQIMNVPIQELSDDYEAFDIGEKTMKEYQIIIKNSEAILWSGPMGYFEMPVFSHGTKAILNAIHMATQNGSYSVAGGGDTLASIDQLHPNAQITHTSTGGTALLSYIAQEKLKCMQ